MSMPSSARSKLTALMSAPAPKASTSPTHALGHGRARPNSAPMTSDDAASAPHPSAVAIDAGRYPWRRRSTMRLKRMRILVLGAAGMLGGKLVERLARDGRLGSDPISQLTLVDRVAAEPPATPGFVV